MPRLRRILLFVALIIMAGPSAGISAEITLRVHHFLGDESLPHTGLIAPWARQVERDSKGRIKVEIYPAMALGGRAPDLIKQVENGTVDIIWTAAAYTPKRFMRTSVFTLPLVHRKNAVATNLAMREIFASKLAREFDGLHPLLLHVHQGHVLHMTSRPVRHIDDLAGLTIRPPGRAAGRWVVEELGASPTKKRHPKLPKALAAGKLDGALMSFQLADTMGVADVSMSHTFLPGNEYFGTSVYLFLMNMTRYRSLPDDLRAVIDKNSGTNLSVKTGHRWEAAGTKALKTAISAGHDVIVISQKDHKEVRTRLERTWSRYAEMVKPNGIDAQNLITAAIAAITRNSTP
jgi:TRAP-type C4-dicarboxylate transport system substrate-binding protein